MFDSCVLGVDPGMAATGLAVVEREGSRNSLRWSDTVHTAADQPEELRLRTIAEHVRAAIAEHAPGALAIERVAWGRNVTSGLRVARATGAVMLVAADAGVAVEEYGPLEVKMAITGFGHAPKGQVRDALARAHGLTSVPSQPDAADAVAVAVCHLTQARLRGAARRAGAR